MVKQTLPRIDRTGQRFGRWVVQSFARKEGGYNVLWNCLCDCGKAGVVSYANLSDGASRSCGCLKKEAQTIHGLARTPEYRTWRAMNYRCYDPAHIYYKHYGGRGIRVCDRWRWVPENPDALKNFITDMGPRPSSKHSIERVDVNGDYVPGNVKWATSREQGNNKRSSHTLSFAGKTLTISEWASEVGIGKVTIRGRIVHGWSVERALTTPPRARRK